jgi:serine/threonine-protein kinase
VPPDAKPDAKPEPTEDDDLNVVASFGRTEGPSLQDVRAAFLRLRARPEEGRAVSTLLALDARKPLPEPLLLTVASALVDRGEEATATRVLARATTTEALVLRADLQSRAGDLAGAIALVERVLLRDFDWPGARERHARWREALERIAPVGASAARRAPARGAFASATLMTSAPDAPFRLLGEVGRGGAGVVYEADDRQLGRKVALKVYHRPDRDRAQLLHEARVAVALAGAGIVRVFDVDPAQGWLVMEWLRLGALRALLRTGDPALFPIDRWAVPLARSLARVHAAGWVHHDVKPANVLLRELDAPVLGDFAAARRAGEPSPPGSLGYVSPERLSGRASSPLDDIYGFGRILEDALSISPRESRTTTPSETPDRALLPPDDWRALAVACTGPDETRADAFAALLERRQTS